jgi:two-component system KDP operon response regulator KdpE
MVARIYIADDDAEIRNLLTLCLIDEGHEVFVARDGQAVLDSVIDDPPDVLVLDIGMPKLNGYQVLEGLESYGIRRLTKVLFLTARGSEAERVYGLERGVDRYVAKPFDTGEFVGTVRELLRASQEDLALQRQEELRKATLLARLESVFES